MIFIPISRKSFKPNPSLTKKLNNLNLLKYYFPAIKSFKKPFTSINMDKLRIIIPKNPNNNILYAFSIFINEKGGMQICKEQFKIFHSTKQGKIFTKEENSKHCNNNLLYYFLVFLQKRFMKTFLIRNNHDNIIT